MMSIPEASEDGRDPAMGPVVFSASPELDRAHRSQTFLVRFSRLQQEAARTHGLRYRGAAVNRYQDYGAALAKKRAEFNGTKQQRPTSTKSPATMEKSASNAEPYPVAIFNVLKHVEAVVNDGLQDLLVVVRTLADPGQIGQNIWQQILVSLRETQNLTLGPLDLLLDVDPDMKTRRQSETGFTLCFMVSLRDNDDNHEWTIELQDGDLAEGQKCDTDACGSSSSGSGLIDIQAPLTSSAESPVDELCCGLEVDAHVEATGVMRLDAHVGDLRALVDVRLDSAFTVSCIEDVDVLAAGYSKLVQNGLDPRYSLLSGLSDILLSPSLHRVQQQQLFGQQFLQTPSKIIQIITKNTMQRSGCRLLPWVGTGEEHHFQSLAMLEDVVGGQDFRSGFVEAADLPAIAAVGRYYQQCRHVQMNVTKSDDDK
ncbi:hypothetical protein EYF80_003219 [Liparis tanakae]|uniref:Uncharacterized protein n=1 Tax=Liparis tanakae TaxID=230148 RepID=A0A4Z2J8F6_9TELE|nr:hypothetical protein EYF80_003219 [Liparis tanakae]